MAIKTKISNELRHEAADALLHDAAETAIFLLRSALSAAEVLRSESVNTAVLLLRENAETSAKLLRVSFNASETIRNKTADATVLAPPDAV